MGEVGEKPLGPVCLKILDRAVGQIGLFVGEPSAPECTERQLRGGRATTAEEFLFVRSPRPVGERISDGRGSGCGSPLGCR
jgi:hypothetical protein